jgi:hypothetical protein
MTVFIDLSFVGVDAGPFNIFSDATVPPYAIPIDINVPAATLLAGATYTVPVGTTTIRIKSTGKCTDEVDFPVQPSTTTSSTTT